MTSKLKNAIFDITRARGYTIIPNWRLESYPQADYLRRLFAHLAIDCVLDVGANLGQYRDFLRRKVDYAGTIVSFEPIPEHVDVLRRRARDDGRWLVERYALGATPGRATFNVMRSSEFSSFLDPDHTASQRFCVSNRVDRQVDVDVCTLAEVIPEIERRTRVTAIYLKMDTQGYDLDVARGAGAAITRVRALQTEASVTALYVGAPDYCTAIRAFQELGFELSGLFPNNPQHFPRLFEVDCHMIARAFRGDDGDDGAKRSP